MSKINLIKVCQAIAMSVFLAVWSQTVTAVEPAEKSAASPSSDFQVLRGEILEIKDLREPKGCMVFTVRDFISGEKFNLFADPYRVSVKISGETKPLSDVLAGSKITAVYQKSKTSKLPQVVSMKISSTSGLYDLLEAVV